MGIDVLFILAATRNFDFPLLVLKLKFYFVVSLVNLLRLLPPSEIGCILFQGHDLRITIILRIVTYAVVVGTIVGEDVIFF